MNKKFNIKTNSNDPKFYVRFPADLKIALEARAAENGRSRGVEIIDIVSKVIEHEIAFHSDFITIGTRVIHLVKADVFGTKKHE